MTTPIQTPIPAFLDEQKVDQVYRVPYQERATEAHVWAEQQGIRAASQDDFRICLLLIDVQNTFCLPEFELFVGGRSGMGAVEDNQRLCRFIYENLGVITAIAPTMDTHTAAQIFHPLFWIDANGKAPAPMTMIGYEDVVEGKWRVNPEMAPYMAADDIQQFALHYTRRLTQDSKYPLTIWPYHSMLGGIGHALVSAIEEACFVHSIARNNPTQYEIKGSNPLTENYSVLSPEVLEDSQGSAIAQKNQAFTDKLLSYDAVIVAGQAKSHCVAWSVDDLLAEITLRDSKLAEKVYLLEDCTSPVVVPDVVDFTDAANEAYQRFADAGMHRVTTQTPLRDWPGMSVSES
ncbi:isochorismatase [Oscillatoria sp. CS-180]|uniref:isochorismatase n=1 Tax=Oscillatoria sp. CS-180 TaxID=3021720 RepID=UPI0023311A76|nr:isochorismatase [Oscillatoria sp. CS-180]MDB9526548.1 isochorismatase [Oscillatoria sp. CS-180]